MKNLTASPPSEFIRSGKWKEGYDASNNMLDEYATKYNLQDQDWRPGMMEMIRKGQEKQ